MFKNLFKKETLGEQKRREWEERRETNDRPFERLWKFYRLDDEDVAFRFPDEETKLLYVSWHLVSSGQSEEYYDDYCRSGFFGYDYTYFDVRYASDMWNFADGGHIRGILPIPKYAHRGNEPWLDIPRYIPEPLNDYEVSVYRNWSHHATHAKRKYALSRWPQWAKVEYLTNVLNDPQKLSNSHIEVVGIELDWAAEQLDALLTDNVTEDTQERNTEKPHSENRFTDEKAKRRYEQWGLVAADPNRALSEREFGLKALKAADDGKIEGIKALPAPS